jgi:hypothetical protein
MNQEKLNKLPKWVQQEINKLEIELDFYKTKVLEMSEIDKTNTFMLIGENEIPLVNNADIEFVINKHTNIRLYLQGNELRIFGSRRINIEPRATNSCFITVEE